MAKGRPSKFDRDRAVETAMTEFWSKGYEAASAKALSERLGITRSSFYNAFGSREALFKEALHLYFARSPDSALAHSDTHPSVRALLKAFFRDVCRVRASDPEARGCLAINSVAELVGSDEILGPFLEECFEASIERFEALVRLAVARGELSARTDCRAKALALQNLLCGLNLMSKVVRDETELWTVARQTLEGLGFDEDRTRLRGP